MNARKLIEGADDEPDDKDEVLAGRPGGIELYNPDGEDFVAHALIWTDSSKRCYAWGLYAEDPDSEQRIRPINDVRQTGHGEDWFIFYIADCYDPPMYAISGRNFEDAYDEFIDWKEDELKIDDRALGDYDLDNLNYSPSGEPVDTDLVQGFDVELVEWS